MKSAFSSKFVEKNTTQINNSSQTVYSDTKLESDNKHTGYYAEYDSASSLSEKDEIILIQNAYQT